MNYLFFKNKFSIFLFLLLLFFSCGKNNVDSDFDFTEVKNSLDSLKEIYAPDKRVALWKVSTTNEAQATVNIKLESQAAKDDLLKIFAAQFPSVNINIELLPEDKRSIHALVNNSVSSIRGEGRHSAELVTQALLGTPLRVFKREAGWYLVQTPNRYIGWINAADIAKFDAAKLQTYQLANKLFFTAQQGFSYTLPDDNSQVISDLVIGCSLKITGEKKNFYHVEYPDGRQAYVKKAEVVEAADFFKRKPDADKLVETAKKFNGIPYLWGGFSSKSIDCSGFTSNIYFMNGIVLQRDASQQIKYGRVITEQFEYGELKKGDLLFFGRRAGNSLAEKVVHVGMYIGDTEFIHASGKVRINSMDSTRSNFTPYYISRFIRAIRILGEARNEGVEAISDNRFYKQIMP